MRMSTLTPPGARIALAVAFAMTGLAFASWVSRIPELRNATGASIAVMGVVLFFLPVGSVIGTLLSSRIMVRFGRRRAARTGLALISCALLGAGVAGAIGSLAVLIPSLVGIGLGFGIGDVALNAEASGLERRLGRSVIPMMHGMYSVGTLAGAGIGAIAIAAGVVPALHLGVLAVVSAIAGQVALTLMPELPQPAPIDHAEAMRTPWRGRILLLGAVALSAAITEGAANGWIGIGVVDGQHGTPVQGVLAYTVFLATMAGVRVLGSRLADRFGRVLPAILGSALGLAGVVTFVVSGPTTGLVGAALWGIGVALGLPFAVSAAGEERGPEAAISRVAAVGYSGYLVAPAVLGALAGVVGVLGALATVVVVFLAGIVLAPALRGRAR